MRRLETKQVWLIGAGILVIVVLGSLVEESGEVRLPSLPSSGQQVAMTRWQHSSGLISAEVPAGWRIDGQIGPAIDQGQFLIQGFAPDGRAFFSLAHNWYSFMEFQYGPYQPGRATVEAIVLPQFLQQQAQFPLSDAYTGVRVVYRGPNARLVMPGAVPGLSIPFDGGTVGFLLSRQDGGVSVGGAYGETMYIASPGTPGLWRLRLFVAAVAPAEGEPEPAELQRAVVRVVTSLDLSPEFFALWAQAHQQTMQQMREYSASMDRVFSGYLESMARSSDASDRAMDRWASMMRGGHYGTDDSTGEEYWVSNDHDYWFVNDRGEVAGNDTADVPTYGDNWRPLRRSWPR